MRDVSWGFWIAILSAVAGSGYAYGMMFYDGSYLGALYALFTCLPIIAFERNLIFPRVRRWIQDLPTFRYIVLELAVYTALISIAFSLASTFFLWIGAVQGKWQEIVFLPFDVWIYALGVCLLMIAVLRVRELLGREIFSNLLFSRYRRPVAEERIFLFVDLVGSTAFAEQFGDLRTLEYLRELFKTFAEPVRRHRGAIDDYIGDSAIITWPMERGTKNARCVRCIFDIFKAIERDADKWKERFGQVPQLRAALHGGPVITAEVGVDHHKITYFGDTVNATARLETLAKTLGVDIVVSDGLARRMTLPKGIVAIDLGSHAVKGRDQPISIMQLGLPAKTQLSLPTARQ